MKKEIRTEKIENILSSFFFAFFFFNLENYQEQRLFFTCSGTVSAGKRCFQVKSKYFRKKCWQDQIRTSISEVTGIIVDESAH